MSARHVVMVTDDKLLHVWCHSRGRAPQRLRLTRPPTMDAGWCACGHRVERHNSTTAPGSTGTECWQCECPGYQLRPRVVYTLVPVAGPDEAQVNSLDGSLLLGMWPATKGGVVYGTLTGPEIWRHFARHRKGLEPTWYEPNIRGGQHG